MGHVIDIGSLGRKLNVVLNFNLTMKFKGAINVLKFSQFSLVTSSCNGHFHQHSERLSVSIHSVEEGIEVIRG